VVIEGGRCYTVTGIADCDGLLDVIPTLGTWMNSWGGTYRNRRTWFSGPLCRPFCKRGLMVVDESVLVGW